MRAIAGWFIILIVIFSYDIASASDETPEIKDSWFFYEAYGNIFYTTTDFQKRDDQADEDLRLSEEGQSRRYIRLDNLRIGLVIPLWFYNKITVDPYIGGQVYYCSSDVGNSNFIAPAAGVRLKPIAKHDIDNVVISFFKDIELYSEVRRIEVFSEKKDKYNGKEKDYLYGIKMYRDYYHELFFEQFFTSLVHYDSAWQDDSRPYFYFSPGWLFQAELHLGLNLNKLYPVNLCQCIYGPYVRSEVFNTPGSSNDKLFWFNRYIIAGGLHFRAIITQNSFHSRWLDIYCEIARVNYLEDKPSNGCDHNIMAGVKLWIQ